MKGTLRLFLVLCVTALSMTLVQAQERTYSGVVKGSDGQPQLNYLYGTWTVQYIQDRNDNVSTPPNLAKFVFYNYLYLHFSKAILKHQFLFYLV